ncbi:MAG TPA: hypothetical protein VMF30_02190 [Pirellulales bacterium]|nr:hypothetical protein [Pirellulales bacterium]
MRQFFACIIVVGLLASPSAAQDQNGPPPGTEALNAKGTIDSIQSDQLLKIKITETESWLIKVEDHTKIDVTGTAEPGFLHNGLHVRFDGEIDKKGNLQAEISELEIFTPEGKNAMGLFADKGPTAKPVGKAGPGKYEIRAKIVSLKDHDVTLAAGSKKLFGKVAENVAVKVTASDFNYVQDGDAVTVAGYYYPANKAAAEKPGQAAADELTIALAKPLVATKKAAKATKAKPTKSAKSKSRGFDEEMEGGEGNSAAPAVQDPFGVDKK